MALAVLGAHQLAGTGHVEAPRGALVGLHLRHRKGFSCCDIYQWMAIGEYSTSPRPRANTALSTLGMHHKDQAARGRWYLRRTSSGLVRKSTSGTTPRRMNTSSIWKMA